MKNLTPSLLLALIALTGCGAAVDDTTELDFAGDPSADFADDGAVDGASADDVAADDAAADDAAADEAVADDETLGTSRQALISTGGGLSAKPWCAARKTCYDACDSDFPIGDTTNTSCKKRCDISTASKCRPGAAAGAGIFIF